MPIRRQIRPRRKPFLLAFGAVVVTSAMLFWGRGLHTRAEVGFELWHRSLKPSSHYRQYTSFFVGWVFFFQPIPYPRIQLRPFRIMPQSGYDPLRL